MDETRIPIGVKKIQFVGFAHKVKKFVITDPDNRDYITSVEFINGTGRVILRWSFRKKNRFFDKWADNEFDGEILLKINDSGCSNDDHVLNDFNISTVYAKIAVK